MRSFGSRFLERVQNFHRFNGADDANGQRDLRVSVGVMSSGPFRQGN